MRNLFCIKAGMVAVIPFWRHCPWYDPIQFIVGSVLSATRINNNHDRVVTIKSIEKKKGHRTQQWAHNQRGEIAIFRRVEQRKVLEQMVPVLSADGIGRRWLQNGKGARALYNTGPGAAFPGVLSWSGNLFRSWQIDEPGESRNHERGIGCRRCLVVRGGFLQQFVCRFRWDTPLKYRTWNIPFWMAFMSPNGVLVTHHWIFMGGSFFGLVLPGTGLETSGVWAKEHSGTPRCTLNFKTV